MSIGSPHITLLNKDVLSRLNFQIGLRNWSSGGRLPNKNVGMHPLSSPLSVGFVDTCPCHFWGTRLNFNVSGQLLANVTHHKNRISRPVESRCGYAGKIDACSWAGMVTLVRFLCSSVSEIDGLGLVVTSKKPCTPKRPETSLFLETRPYLTTVVLNPRPSTRNSSFIDPLR